MKMHSYNSVNQSFHLFLQEYLEMKAATADAKLDFLKENELKSRFSSQSRRITYPENLNLINYIDFLLVPSFVYELEYPRTEK